MADSFEFSAFITGKTLPEGISLVSIDVVSLFTKIPTERAVDIAQTRLQNDKTLTEHTMLSPREVTNLLLFYLNNNSVRSPVSVTVANLVMEDVEERALSTIALHFYFRKDKLMIHVQQLKKTWSKILKNT